MSAANEPCFTFKEIPTLADIPEYPDGTRALDDQERVDALTQVRQAPDPFEEARAWAQREAFVCTCGPLLSQEGDTPAVYAERVRSRNHFLEVKLGAAQPDSSAAQFWQRSLQENLAFGDLLNAAVETLLARERLAAAVADHARTCALPQLRRERLTRPTVSPPGATVRPNRASS